MQRVSRLLSDKEYYERLIKSKKDRDTNFRPFEQCRLCGDNLLSWTPKDINLLKYPEDTERELNHECRHGE